MSKKKVEINRAPVLTLPIRNTQRTKRRPLSIGLSIDYFRRCVHRHHRFEVGEKPERVGTEMPSQVSWRAYLCDERAKNVIHIARRFEQQRNLPSVHGYARGTAAAGQARQAAGIGDQGGGYDCHDSKLRPVVSRCQ